MHFFGIVRKLKFDINNTAKYLSYANGYITNFNKNLPNCIDLNFT